MRSDMKKVVTERPRGGGGVKSPKGEKSFWQECPEEDYPRGEKIRAKWARSCGKHFTDVLGPLYRYLLKQVGRKWDAVYSEVAQNLPKTSMQNIHVYTHLWQFVEKDVKIVDRVAMHQGGRWHDTPILSYGRYAQLFIHPGTGLLCKAKKGPGRYRQRELRKPDMAVPGIKVYPGVQYHKVADVWYEVEVRNFELDRDHNGLLVFPKVIVDEVLARKYESLEQLKFVYGGKYLAVSKRPLTKREIRFAGLK